MRFVSFFAQGNYVFEYNPLACQIIFLFKIFFCC